MQGKTARLSKLVFCFTTLLLHKKLYCQLKNTIFSLRQKCNKNAILIVMKKEFDSKSAIILGMHDALVSLTGLIAGLCFVFADTNIIVISCIVSSITASLSMGAANYLAVKAVNKENAMRAALYTAGAYMATCALLILPFFIFLNRVIALLSVFLMVVLIIYLFNIGFYRNNRFYKHFYEMLLVCFTVSLVAFAIGQGAKYFLGV